MADSDDRRRAVRHRVCFLARVRNGEARARRAMVRNASRTGAFVLTRAPLQVGEDIEMELLCGAERDCGQRAKAKVVRTGPWQNPEIWTFGVAVSFDQPLAPDFALEEIARQQASWA